MQPRWMSQPDPVDRNFDDVNFLTTHVCAKLPTKENCVATYDLTTQAGIKQVYDEVFLPHLADDDEWKDNPSRLMPPR